MADCQITCITKPHVLSSHEHITHVGHPPNWVWPVQDVIRSIDDRKNTFYVIDPVSRKRADVGVIRQVKKNPYLRTYANGDWNSNLLSLNQCSLIRR